jgi:hypothetical protein
MVPANGFDEDNEDSTLVVFILLSDIQKRIGCRGSVCLIRDWQQVFQLSKCKSAVQ